MEGYSDTVILECNRASSMEVRTNNEQNNAIWTNRAGDGIQLNIGDQVTLHSCFISELGAQTGKIEIKGEKIGSNPERDSDGGTAYYTTESQITTVYDQTTDISDAFPDHGTGPAISRDIPDKWWKASVSLTQPTYELKDNEVNVVVHPYKNMNGEYICSLPRRFTGSTALSFNAQSNDPNTIPDVEYKPYRACDHNGFRLWAYGDRWKFEASELGATFYPLNEYQWCEPDIKNQNHRMINGFTNSSLAKISNLHDVGAIPVFPNQKGFFSQKVKSDNSRYFLFQLMNVYRDSRGAADDNRLSGHGGHTEGSMLFAFGIPQPYDQTRGDTNYWTETRNGLQTGLPVNYAPYQADPIHTANTSGTQREYMDPCRFEYVQVKDIVSLQATTGFNAPKDVSVELTEQLNAQTPLDSIEYEFKTNQQVIRDWEYSGDSVTAVMQDSSVSRTQKYPITFESSTPCYKPRNCATNYLMNSSTYEEFKSANQHKNGSAITQGSATEVYKYMDAYQTIGVKRPELFVWGRNVNTYFTPLKTHAGYSRILVDGTIPNASQYITTDLEWTQVNFDKLIYLFNAQKQYPELFDDYKCQTYFLESASSGSCTLSVDTSRFLHMNTRDNGSGVSDDPQYTTGLEADGATFVPSQVQFPRDTLGSDNYEFDPTNIGVNYGPGTATGTALTPSDMSGNVAGASEVLASYGAHVGTSLHFKTPTQGATANDWDGSWTNSSNMSSAPLFIDYNPATANTSPFSEGREREMHGGSYDTLAYGFGRKDTIGGTDYIALSTQFQVGGIQRHFYNGSGSKQGADWKTNASGCIGVGKDRSLGWDYHFTAYGCPVTLITNGAQDEKDTDFNETTTSQLPVDGVIRGRSQVNKNTATASAETRGVYKDWMKNASSTFPPVALAPMKAYVPAGVEMKIDYTNPKVLSSACDTPIYGEKYMNKIYIGANQPSIVYDDSADQRFQIKFLHTPEYIGNPFGAGQPVGAGPDPSSLAISTADQPNTPAYKLNKHLLKNNYSPDQSPYTNKITTRERGVPLSAQRPILDNACLTGTTVEFFEGLEYNTIFDAMSGISLGEWAIPEVVWASSLMGIMGFTWDQFHHPNPASPQTRITNSTTLNDMDIVTTCSANSIEDVHLYTRNIYGEPTFGISLPTNRAIRSLFGDDYSDSMDSELPADAGTESSVWQPITVTQTSFLISAKNLATKVKRPYYTIQSDIIGRSRGIGGGQAGGQTMPIVGVVSKESGYGDFFFSGTQPQSTFTITQPRVITSVRNNIKDPDGTDTICGPNSAVIYQITRHRNVDMTPVSTIMSQHAQMTPKEQKKDVIYNQLMAETSAQQIQPQEQVFPLGTFESQPATGVVSQDLQEAYDIAAQTVAELTLAIETGQQDAQEQHRIMEIREQEAGEQARAQARIGVRQQSSLMRRRALQMETDLYNERAAEIQKENLREDTKRLQEAQTQMRNTERMRQRIRERPLTAEELGRVEGGVAEMGRLRARAEGSIERARQLAGQLEVQEGEMAALEETLQQHGKDDDPDIDWGDEDPDDPWGGGGGGGGWGGGDDDDDDDPGGGGGGGGGQRVGGTGGTPPRGFQEQFTMGEFFGSHAIPGETAHETNIRVQQEAKELRERRSMRRRGEPTPGYQAGETSPEARMPGEPGYVPNLPEPRLPPRQSGRSFEQIAGERAREMLAGLPHRDISAAWERARHDLGIPAHDASAGQVREGALQTRGSVQHHQPDPPEPREPEPEPSE